MFERIFIEEDLLAHPQVKKIINRFHKVPTKTIRRFDDIWGKVKKPYLQKRSNLNLFLAKKRGNLIKKAPDAYGIASGTHYYFIHAYNCIYECDYCYLQGYFKTPDLVFFLNHQEILDEMQKIIGEATDETWFHAGEFSDSLALTHLTGELSFYFDFFKKHPSSFLELRTKSSNIKELLKFDPLPNIITTFSLGPNEHTKNHDHKTAPLTHRLKSMKKLFEQGHPLGVHLDPIIYKENFEEEYQEFIQEFAKQIPLHNIRYISIGVVRFTKDVYVQVKKNYPESLIHTSEFIKSFDNKIRYPRPLRLWMLSKIKEILIKNGALENKIYLCME